MPQFPQGLGLNLTDTLAGHLEGVSHLFQGVGVTVVQAEAQAQYLRLPFLEGPKHLRDLLLQEDEGGGVGGRDDVLILDEITQMAVLLLPDGRFQGNRLLGDFQDGPHLFHRHFQALGDLVRDGLPAQFLDQIAGNLDGLVDGLDHVHRDADGAGLVGDGPGNGLADPPGGVGGELVAPAVLELFHRPHQADVAFLDQVQEGQAAVGVFLGDGDDQAQVGLHQFHAGLIGFPLARRGCCAS